VRHVEVQPGPGFLATSDRSISPSPASENDSTFASRQLAGQRPGRLAQDQADPLLWLGQPLAGAQVERHAAPAGLSIQSGRRRRCPGWSPAATPGTSR
jgi:hypothetical protein